jgi:3-deoxy-manno-octulosonate cytidylyltransferase (CMP-KDO synthetase)
MAARFKVVIPARYASSRLPGKPLLPIAGKPMIAHVCDRALESGAEEIIVATDDERIFSAVETLGIRALMTRPDHQSGTERLAEVVEKTGWGKDDIIVNVQGDEPLVPGGLIRELAEMLVGEREAGVATLAAEIVATEEIFNPNAVKVVLDKNNFALYFSRAPIPWERDAFNKPEPVPSGKMTYLRHIGMYGYRAGFLHRYCSWQPSALETVEALEQLRILWHGEKIKVLRVAEIPEAGVDTPEDLLRVEQRILAQFKNTKSGSCF